jgi:hypothetical protein
VLPALAVYCQHSRKPLITEVSGMASIQPHQDATATTSPCPAGRKLVFGGFSTDPAGSTLDAPSSVAAYGYCLKI